MSLQDFVPTPRFEDYRETFKDFYRMERRDDGVLLVAAHTQGGPVQLRSACTGMHSILPEASIHLD